MVGQPLITATLLLLMAGPTVAGGAVGDHPPSQQPSGTGQVPYGNPPQYLPSLNGNNYGNVLQLHISCRQLKMNDNVGQGDPMAVVYVKPDWNRDEIVAGRTEHKINNANPEFSRPITILNDDLQKLRVAIYDVEKNNPVWDFANYVSETELLSVGNLTSNVETTIPLLRKGKPTGKSTLTIKWEAKHTNDIIMEMKVVGKELAAKDQGRTSDPFLRIYLADGSKYYESEVIKKTVDPGWKPFQVSMHELFGSNNRNEIRVDILDWNKYSWFSVKKIEVPIGYFKMTANDISEIRNGREGKRFSLLHPKNSTKKSQSATKNGFIQVQYLRKLERPLGYGPQPASGIPQPAYGTQGLTHLGHPPMVPQHVAPFPPAVQPALQAYQTHPAYPMGAQPPTNQNSYYSMQSGFAVTSPMPQNHGGPMPAGPPFSTLGGQSAYAGQGMGQYPNPPRPSAPTLPNSQPSTPTLLNYPGFVNPPNRPNQVAPPPPPSSSSTPRSKRGTPVTMQHQYADPNNEAAYTRKN